jgi:hypothetical protein
MLGHSHTIGGSLIKKLITAASLAFGIIAASAAVAGETPAPADASVYFINIKDGDVLSNPVTIQFGLKGMGVAPAVTEKKNTGHHQLIIDGTVAGEALDAPSILAKPIAISAADKPKQPWTCPKAVTRCNWFWATGVTSHTISL